MFYFFSLHDANTHMASSFALFYRRAIRQSAEVVNQMVCVERVSEYSQLESEADLQTETDEDVPFWPFSGTKRWNHSSSKLVHSLSEETASITEGSDLRYSLWKVHRCGWKNWQR